MTHGASGLRSKYRDLSNLEYAIQILRKSGANHVADDAERELNSLLERIEELERELNNIGGPDDD